MAMISSSRLAELQRAPPAWKFCAVQSQERFDRENAQRADQANMNGRRFFDCRKWKTTARPRKTLPGSPDQGQQNKCAREEPSRGHPQGPRGSGSAWRLPSWGCAGTPAASATPGGCPPAWLPMGATPQGWPTSGSSSAPEGHERAHQSELGFERQNRFRNLQETQRIEKKAFRARAKRAREEPSPGPPASETDARPPGHQPRGGAPARPRLSRGQEGPTYKMRIFSA